MQGCIICGNPLPPKARKYCSEACKREAEHRRVREGKPRPHPTPFGLRVCSDCGQEFYGHIKSKRCPSCQEEQDRRNRAAYKARKRAGHVRSIGSTDYCIVCGNPYVVEGGLQKYCPDCKAEATRDAIRHARRDYMASQREDPEKNEVLKSRKRRVPSQRICRHCGAAFSTLGASQFCSDACRAAHQKAYMSAYDMARKDKRAAERRKQQKQITPEQREEINRRARENYRKRKEKSR